MSLDFKLFEGFDPESVAAAVQAREAELHQLGHARTMRRQHTVQTRRVTSDAAVATILDAPLPQGTSQHVLSTGDVDVLSFTRRLIELHGWMQSLHIATWRINADDLSHIEHWIDAGQVEAFHLLTDLRFARLAPTEYAHAMRLVDLYPPSSLTLCLNHSKVTLLANAETDTWLVIESSANVNTNRRLEQTAIHHSRELHDFYAAAYAAIRQRRAHAQAHAI